MPFIEITEEKLVHVEKIDRQHEEIAKTITNLYNLCRKGSHKKQITEMEKFKKLLNKHFDYEDHLMLENRDPGFISHKLEHNRVRQKTARVLDALILRGDDLKIEYVTGLKDWLDNHLIFKDIKLGKYLNSMGIE